MAPKDARGGGWDGKDILLVDSDYELLDQGSHLEDNSTFESDFLSVILAQLKDPL